MFTVHGIEKMIPQELLAPFSQEAIDIILEDVMEAARDWWVTEAKAGLHGSKSDYIHGIQSVEMAPGQATLTLVGTVPNLVEHGMDETDMRTTLLGPNVPITPPGEYGKHLTIRPGGDVGFYRAIPFRHSPPGGGGGAGKPMPKDVYQAAKKLRARISDPYTGSSWAEGEEEEEKQKTLGDEYGKNYAGMIRESKAYRAFEMTPQGPKGRGVQSSYVTFRTISTLEKGGWIRPATPGKHYAERALEYAEKSMLDALEAFSEAP